ncbi:MAG TPA: hypothetical protein DCR55_04585 [Lentisphaeria bacterium]|nr:hypothetical protein [Lentisphaeria bacterium]
MSINALRTALFLAMLSIAAFGATEVVNSDLATLTKTAPDKVVVGEEYAVELTIRANANVGDVTVTDQVPEGARLVRTEPKAEVVGNTVTWKTAELAAGSATTMTLVLSALGDGELSSCATFSVVPVACVTTRVGRPALAITKTGPEMAILNDMITYDVTVTNTGTAVARNVVVTDNVPDGLEHAGGKALIFELGNLAPGESRSIPVTCKAAARGRHCNTAVAKSSNVGEVTAQACTKVLIRGLEIAKTGIPVQFLGKTAGYTIVAKNTGDTDLTNVIVTDTAPAGTRIISAEGATVAGNVATWTVANFGAGQSKTYKLVLTSRQAGTHCNNVNVTSTEGLTAESQACTDWKGHPALLLEVIDTVDPLLPGEQTTYLIKVTNQGTASDTNVSVAAAFPAQITPISAAGHTDAKVSGKNVTVTPYPELGPGQFIEWQIQAKADTAGDSRLKVKLSSSLLKTPVTEEESTHVY